MRHAPPLAIERTEFFHVWHQVSAGLASAAANLDRLPEPRRGMLLEIVQDLQVQQARLFSEVEQLSPTSVAAITYVQRATGELYALAERVRSLAAHTRPAPATPHAPGPPLLAPPPHGQRVPVVGAPRNRFDSTLDKLHVALHVAGSERAIAPPHHPAHGAAPIQYAQPHYASHAAPVSHGSHGPHCACQQPVQIVYLPAPPDHGPMPRIARHDDRDDRDDDDRSSRRGRRNRDERRAGEETPAAMVSTLLKGMGGVSVLIASAVMVANVSFADLFGGGRTALPPPVAVTQPLERVALAEPPQHVLTAPAPGEKTTARLDTPLRRDPIEGSRGCVAAEPPAVTPDIRSTATVAPIARAKPLTPGEARRVGELTAADLSLKPTRPPVRVISKAAIVEPEPDVNSELPVAEAPSIAARGPVPKKVAMVAPPPPPAPVARQPEKPAEAPGKSEPEGGGLYVAVLSTHKEAAAARDEFAELQKKHRDVLGSKQSEVQMAAGATGAWHRLVVTPALPKDAANDLCTRLRSAGYGKCWVKPY